MRKDLISPQFIAPIASYTHVIVTPPLHSGSDRREKEPDMKLLDFEVELGKRTQVGGLTVIPLIGAEFLAPAYLTGPEAFEAGLLEVGELSPPEVPKLAVTNLSDLPVLLVEGEMLVGGDQNRTMNVTVLCPPRARTVVPVSCVEAGRWGARRTMSGRRKHAPGSLRAAKTAYLEPRSDDVGARGTDQGLVWDEVSRQSMAHDVYSGTAALDDVQEEVEERISRATRMHRAAAQPSRRRLHYRGRRGGVGHLRPSVGDEPVSPSDRGRACIGRHGRVPQRGSDRGHRAVPGPGRRQPPRHWQGRRLGKRGAPTRRVGRRRAVLWRSPRPPGRVPSPR